ncbi:hypothetical protein ISN44_As11g027250 [Arabidopsis suecica]|uniref:Uncharacterized protein n=1 Tax=Arabidopsis suecica TaxID=45249 RepID=A0A8T1ZEJ4_ARASU|nr:hypothetical protein ISN44_As11g027250 [Arabidopsis suecica]
MVVVVTVMVAMGGSSNGSGGDDGCEITMVVAVTAVTMAVAMPAAAPPSLWLNQRLLSLRRAEVVLSDGGSLVDLQWGTMTLDDGSRSGGFLRQSLRGGTSPPMSLFGGGGSVLRRIQGFLAMLPPTTPDGELIRSGGEKKTIWTVEEEGKLSNKARLQEIFVSTRLTRLSISRISMSVLGLGPK